MRVLLLSYCFPPVPLIEAQVAAKVMAHVSAEVDVIAADERLWRLAPDHSIDAFLAEHFPSIVRVRAPHVPLLLAAQNRVPVLAERPDALTFLNSRVTRELRRRRIADYDLLITRGQFHSIHLVPLTIAERPPWVAHFSDPWVGNRTRGSAPRVRWINERKEARVVDAADAVVFTSAAAANFTMARYPEALAAKARHVPHCFVGELFDGGGPSEGAGKTDGKIVARHVGNLRWNRDPEPLFRALLAAAEAEPGLLGELSVELLGLVNPVMLQTEGARRLPPGLLTVSPPVDYRTSLRAMAGADLLLVTEIDAARSIDLHAKIVDYTGAGVPILAITPPGPTAELVTALGGWHAPPGDPAAGGRALLAAMEEARSRRGAVSEPWGDPEVRARYSAEHVGTSLGDIYRECIHEPIALA